MTANVAVNSVFFLIILFLIKHLIVDFFVQTPKMAMNKGTYRHVDGYIHVFQHMLGSIVVYVLFGMVTSTTLFVPVVHIIVVSLVLEFVIHYHMDWFKMWYCKKRGYKPHPSLGCTQDHSIRFWWWMGIDQTVHILTYVGMTMAIIAPFVAV